MKPVTVALLWALCGLACTPSPPPRHASQDFLERRKMTRHVLEVAKAAESSGDLEKEVQAYAVLVELWPDLPESRQGGAWARQLEARQRLLAYNRKLERAHNKGRALEDRLTTSGQDLSSMGQTLDKVVGETPQPPEFPKAPSLELNAAGLVERGWLARGAMAGAMAGSRP